MSYFDNFFTIPTIHIDGDYESIKEEKKEKLGDGDVEFNPEFLVCETDISPEDEVLYITEGWYPSEQGFEYTRDNGKFPCCRVTFMNAGQFLVEMPKKRFKKEWSNFKESLPKPVILQLKGEEQIEEFLNNQKNKENE